MSCSERAGALSPFLVMEILERAQELERQGRSIVHLEIGEPDFGTPEPVVEAGTMALQAGHTHYTHSLGMLRLREAIAERYARVYGVRVSAEQILVSAGSSLALLFAFGALLEPGDEVIAATPHYPCYPNFVRFFGGRFVGVPTCGEEGYVLDPDAVARAITQRTRAILINSPANPTGAVLREDRLKALAELGVLIVSDEIYHGLVYGAPAPSILQFTDNAIVVDGFSKRYAMTGWRLGYAIAPQRYVRTLQTMQQNFLISAAAFTQVAAMSALQCGEYTRQMVATYRQRRDLMVSVFRDLGFGIPVVPEGAFYVFADASRYTRDSLAFALELLECASVAVAPGVDFGEAGRCSVRLSYAASEEHILEAGRRIAEYLRCRTEPRPQE